MILVFGATGNIGRELVAELVAGGFPVRAVSRDLGAASATMPSEVDIREADPALLKGFDELLDGVSALFLPQRLVARSAELLAAAARVGVERVVYVSSLIAGAYPASVMGRTVAAGERTVMDSGLAWTLVRPWEFQSNTLVWAPSILAGDVVRLPRLGNPSPSVAPSDIAAVAARALTSDGHDGATYPLTGPAELTVAEKVRTLGTTLGRELTLEVTGDVPPHDDPVVAAVLTPGVCALDSPGVLPTVERITGRPAHGFARWARHHAAAFTPS